MGMSKSGMAFLSKIARASSNSKSLRTTIPKEVVEYFELDVHDVLIWDVKENRLTVKKWDGL